MITKLSFRLQFKMIRIITPLYQQLEYVGVLLYLSRN